MTSFRDILVYAEVEDDDSLGRVVQLAKAHGAAVTICEVVAPAPSFKDSAGVVDRLKSHAWSTAFARLRRTHMRLSTHFAIDYTVLTGVPYIAITEQVVEQEFDLVVHISEPVLKADGTGLNPTGMHLTRKCPCAVWTIHPRPTSTAGPVLLALDREIVDEAGAAEAFALSIATTAVNFATSFNRGIYVVHAWQPYGEALLDDSELNVSEDECAQYVTEQQTDTEGWFERMMQRVSSIAEGQAGVESSLIRGASVDVIGGLSAELDACMVIMGTVGTSANPGVLIGETTESFLSRSGATVLTMKPPGFVSPLTTGMH